MANPETQATLGTLDGTQVLKKTKKNLKLKYLNLYIHKWNFLPSLFKLSFYNKIFISR